MSHSPNSHIARRQLLWRQFYVMVLPIVCFGYSITTVLMIWLGAPIGEANFLIKAILFALSGLSVLLTLPNARKASAALIPLWLFLACYAVRLIYDVSGRGILFGAQTPLYVYGYFFGLTVLPIIALNLGFTRLDTDRIFRWIFAVVVVANVVLFIYSLTAPVFNADDAFAGRMEVAGQDEGTAVLNPLTFGMMGAMLGAMSIGVLTTAERLRMSALAGFALALALSFSNILFSASRGPFLAFALVVVVTAILLTRSTFVRNSLRIRQTTWVFLAAIVGVVIYLALFSGKNIFLFERFLMMFENRTGGVLEERDFIRDVAWQDFLSSPIIGSSYAVSVDNASPHNVILESLMATGLIGTGLLGLTMLVFGTGLWRVLRGDQGASAYCLGLATLCLVTMAMTSYSIGQSPDLWIFIALITLIAFSPETRQGDVPPNRAGRPPIGGGRKPTLPHSPRTIIR